MNKSEPMMQAENAPELCMCGHDSDGHYGPGQCGIRACECKEFQPTAPPDDLTTLHDENKPDRFEQWFSMQVAENDEDYPSPEEIGFARAAWNEATRGENRNWPEEYDKLWNEAERLHDVIGLQSVEINAMRVELASKDATIERISVTAHDAEQNSKYWHTRFEKVSAKLLKLEKEQMLSYPTLLDQTLEAKDATIASLREENEKLKITVNAAAGGAAQGMMLHSKITNAYYKGWNDQEIIAEEYRDKVLALQEQIFNMMTATKVKTGSPLIILCMNEIPIGVYSDLDKAITAKIEHEKKEGIRFPYQAHTFVLDAEGIR